MNIKKLVIGTIAGGITYFFLGFVMYGLVMEGFFSAHTAPGIAKSDTEMKYYPLVLGNMATACLITWIFLQWAKIRTFAEGLKAGALIGFLMGAGFELVVYDTAKMVSAVGTVVSIFVITFNMAIVGGVVGAVLGRGKETE
jgi:hypothetical protein